MGSKTDYLENKILDHVLRNTAYTSPTTVYVALCTSTPTDSAAGTEVSGGSYARTAASFAAASSGSIANSSAVTFPTASGSWGTVTHFEIWDASTSGNRLYWGALTTSKTPTSGDVVSFAIGALTVTED